MSPIPPMRRCRLLLSCLGLLLLGSNLIYADTFISGKRMFPGPIDVSGATTDNILKMNANGVFVPATDDSGSGTMPTNDTTSAILIGTGSAWAQETDCKITSVGNIVTAGDLTLTGGDAILGANDTAQATITLYGNASTLGAAGYWYNSADEDTTTDYYTWIADGNFKLLGDATTILSISETLFTSSVDLTVTGGDVNVGVDDTTRGQARYYAPSTGVGGILYLYNSADVDTSINEWAVGAQSSGDFKIGGSNGSRGVVTDLAIDDATGNVTITNDLAAVDLAATGTLTVTGATALNGGISCDTNKFLVADTTGNTTIAGTLSVAGAAALNAGISVDTNKFTVADATGNTAIAGTLDVTGATSIAGVLDIGSSGNEQLSAADDILTLEASASIELDTSTTNVTGILTVEGSAQFQGTTELNAVTLTNQDILSGATIDSTAGAYVELSHGTPTEITTISGAAEGRLLYIVNVGTSNVTFTDGSTFALADTTRVLNQYDTLVLIYASGASSRWCEVSYSNN